MRVARLHRAAVAGALSATLVLTGGTLALAAEPTSSPGAALTTTSTAAAQPTGSAKPSAASTASVAPITSAKPSASAKPTTSAERAAPAKPTTIPRSTTAAKPSASAKATSPASAKEAAAKRAADQRAAAQAEDAAERAAAAAERKAEDRAAIAEAAARIAALQTQADDAGRIAQKAGEKANDATARSTTARLVAADARTAANAAAERARVSRARAAAIAARLARTDYGTLPLSLMLNGRTAGGVLDGLSAAGHLSGTARTLYEEASADAARARELESQQVAAAAAAATAADDATAAYRDAKKGAAAANTAVAAALAEQQRLLGALAADGSGAALADTCAALGETDVAACSAPGRGAPAGSGIGGRVVAFARAQIGDPYVFAAAGPDAWDCSGITLGAWASVGVAIGIHSATAQYRLARDRGELVPVAEAVPGDLLFYTDGGGDMYHVTIASGEGRMIEAPYPGASVREVPIRQGDLLAVAAHVG